MCPFVDLCGEVNRRFIRHAPIVQIDLQTFDNRLSRILLFPWGSFLLKGVIALEHAIMDTPVHAHSDGRREVATGHDFLSPFLINGSPPIRGRESPGQEVPAPPILQ